MIEAQDVAGLADGGHCCNELEALKRQKGFHGGAQLPGFKQISANRGIRHIDRDPLNAGDVRGLLHHVYRS